MFKLSLNNLSFLWHEAGSRLPIVNTYKTTYSQGETLAMLVFVFCGGSCPGGPTLGVFVYLQASNAKVMVAMRRARF